MMDGSWQPRIPIYVRWTWQERTMKPLYLNSTAHEYYADPPDAEKHPHISLTPTKCFERVIRKNTGDILTFPNDHTLELSFILSVHHEAFSHSCIQSFCLDKNKVKPNWRFAQWPIMIRHYDPVFYFPNIFIITIIIITIQGVTPVFTQA